MSRQTSEHCWAPQQVDPSQKKTTSTSSGNPSQHLSRPHISPPSAIIHDSFPFVPNTAPLQRSPYPKPYQSLSVTSSPKAGLNRSASKQSASLAGASAPPTQEISRPAYDTSFLEHEGRQGRLALRRQLTAGGGEGSPIPSEDFPDPVAQYLGSLHDDDDDGDEEDRNPGFEVNQLLAGNPLLVAPEWPVWAEYTPDDDRIETSWTDLLQPQESSGPNNGAQVDLAPAPQQ